MCMFHPLMLCAVTKEVKGYRQLLQVSSDTCSWTSEFYPSQQCRTGLASSIQLDGLLSLSKRCSACSFPRCCLLLPNTRFSNKVKVLNLLSNLLATPQHNHTCEAAEGNEVHQAVTFCCPQNTTTFGINTKAFKCLPLSNLTAPPLKLNHTCPAPEGAAAGCCGEARAGGS